jgi:hypothetical protein
MIALFVGITLVTPCNCREQAALRRCAQVLKRHIRVESRHVRTVRLLPERAIGRSDVEQPSPGQTHVVDASLQPGFIVELNADLLQAVHRVEGPEVVEGVRPGFSHELIRVMRREVLKIRLENNIHHEGVGEAKTGGLDLVYPGDLLRDVEAGRYTSIRIGPPARRSQVSRWSIRAMMIVIARIGLNRR